MNNQFAKHWDHTLTIKHIFMGRDPLPVVSETADRAKQVASAIKSLMEKLSEDDRLRDDLDDCLDGFDLTGIDNAYEARDRFNSALAELYDQADYGKRVWIK